MENLKIRVTTEQESKEAQELFFELGYGWHVKGKSVSYLDKILSDYFGWLVLWKPPYLTNTVIQMGSGFEDCKEITLQELRDMVVLKRNDVGDATHTDQDGWKWYIGSDSYVWQAGNAQQLKQWDRSSLDAVDLKPIKEEVMKEFLNPEQNYSLVQCCVGKTPIPESWIEVPEGAETFNYFDNEDNSFFLKGRGDELLFSNKDNNWGWRSWGCYDLDDVICLWRRNEEPTMQEQLDYADELRDMGESGWSKEKHSHYKKDVSHLNHIDVYRVLELYGVESHAVGHAIKKLLCSGQRGAKDHKQDIQEAIDSLNRELEMVKEDEI